MRTTDLWNTLLVQNKFLSYHIGNVRIFLETILLRLMGVACGTASKWEELEIVGTQGVAGFFTTRSAALHKNSHENLEFTKI